MTARAVPQRLSRRGVLAAGTGAAALYLAACGGDKDSGSGSGSNVAPAGTVSAGAPVAVNVDPETLIPDGIKKNYPRIYEYHWSRQTFSQSQPKYGGVFRTDNYSDPPNWDPTDPGYNSFSGMFQLFFNRLIRPDMSYERAFRNEKNFFKLLLTNDLAERWEQPDPQTYTFTLKKGVKFHNVEPTNGHELTTDDVKFSFDAYRQPTSSAQMSIFRHVDKVEVIDKYSFSITMKQPAAYFLYSQSGPLTIIFSRQAYEKQGGLKGSKPTGTGPFILEKHEYRNILTGKKNPDYFVPGRPYLDGVEVRWIPDRAAMLAAYRSGQVDAFPAKGGWDEFESIMRTEKGKTDVNVFQQNSLGQPNFGVIHFKPPFNDLRVRQAVSMALDRNAMVKARYKEGRWAIGIPTDWTGQDYPSTPEQFGPNFQFNPGEAKKLLQAAGVDNMSFNLTVSTATGAPDDQVPLAMEYWKAIGLKPEIKVMDVVAFNKAYFGRELDGMTFGASFTAGTDLDDFTYRNLKSGEATNYFGISDPQMDALLDAQQREFDRTKREGIGAQILKRELEQVNRVWGVSYFLPDFKRPYVQGGYISHDVYFWANALGLYQLADTWLDK